MHVTIHNTTLKLVQGDITLQDTEAIVNAANSSLMGGGGVDGAIHRAGGPSILEECKKNRQKKGTCPPGQAVITTGGNLQASYVIHTVGPIWNGGNRNECDVLAQSYTNSLVLAERKGIKTISFPSISTGAYRFPIEEAARLALKMVSEYVQGKTRIEEVRFILFSQADYNTYCSLLAEMYHE
ncbi:O-acetyl-ADP-ribose deacetylase [Chlamydiota bacterium]